MKTWPLLLILGALISLPAIAQDETDITGLEGLKFRNIGPTRGGRSVAVTGVAQDPLVYYMGGTGGGVWKTTNAGSSWFNVSDKFFKTGSVGAVAVAPSDPNFVVAGMGESPRFHRVKWLRSSVPSTLCSTVASIGHGQLTC